MTAAVFVSGRADLGPLGPVLRCLATSDVGLVVLTGVGFDEETAAAALADAGVEGAQVRVVGPRLGGDTPGDAVRAGSALTLGVA